MEALFSSLVGGEALRTRILQLIAEAASLALSERVEIHIMMFAFTDAVIADALAEAVLRRPSITVRILADWRQRTLAHGQQSGHLAALGISNLQVRYTSDQPYVWDPAAAQMRWSYHASRGLLHHKTLAVLVNARPWRLICGSFNWTASAVRSYENLIIFNADQPGSRQLIARIELEFEALWSDSRATLSPPEAHQHYRMILAEYRGDPTLQPAAIAGLAQGREDPLLALDPDCYPQAAATMSLNCRPAVPLANPSVAIAFSSCAGQQPRGRTGHAETNRIQQLFLCRNSGRIKLVPLTITTLALDTIAHAIAGDTLLIAMYGLSPRVPEYGALLDAARRGVHLQVLLDRQVGADVAARLADVQRLEALPVEVRTAGRMMHQKYLVNTRSGAVLTGTANMSTDASGRHREHRIRVSGCPRLSQQFCDDFATIWRRVAPPAPAG